MLVAGEDGRGDDAEGRSSICTPAERAEHRANSPSCSQIDTRAAASLTPAERTRADELREKEQRGELRSFVSYVDETWFYHRSTSLIVGIYTMLGGFQRGGPDRRDSGRC